MAAFAGSSLPPMWTYSVNSFTRSLRRRLPSVSNARSSSCISPSTPPESSGFGFFSCGSAFAGAFSAFFCCLGCFFFFLGFCGRSWSRNGPIFAERNTPSALYRASTPTGIQPISTRTTKIARSVIHHVHVIAGSPAVRVQTHPAARGLPASAPAAQPVRGQHADRPFRSQAVRTGIQGRIRAKSPVSFRRR